VSRRRMVICHACRYVVQNVVTLRNVRRRHRVRLFLTAVVTPPPRHAQTTTPFMPLSSRSYRCCSLRLKKHHNGQASVTRASRCRALSRQYTRQGIARRYTGRCCSNGVMISRRRTALSRQAYQRWRQERVTNRMKRHKAKCDNNGCCYVAI